MSLLRRVEEMSKNARARPKRGEPAKVVQLPLWPQPVRAVPNGVLRSALFGAIAKGARHYAKAELIASLDGIEVRYTGERLDQGDLDAWESVLHAVRLQAMGEQCRVTSYALLKLMGQTDTGKNRSTLHSRITRLRANAVEIRQGKFVYIGGLIDDAAKDERTHEWVITLNPRLRDLFARDQFTQVDWSVRHELRGKPLAQWLHGFYASHARPYPLKVETLLKLSGSENNSPTSARQTLRKALDAVAEASAAHGVEFGYAIHSEDLVHVEKVGSGPQRRLLAKRANNRRKARA